MCLVAVYIYSLENIYSNPFLIFDLSWLLFAKLQKIF